MSRARNEESRARTHREIAPPLDLDSLNHLISHQPSNNNEADADSAALTLARLEVDSAAPLLAPARAAGGQPGGRRGAQPPQLARVAQGRQRVVAQTASSLSGAHQELPPLARPRDDFDLLCVKSH